MDIIVLVAASCALVYRGWKKQKPGKVSFDASAPRVHEISPRVTEDEGRKSTSTYSPKQRKELQHSWQRVMLESAMDADDVEEFRELLAGVGGVNPTRLNATWTVRSQELTLGGVLARKAAQTGKAWALQLLGAHPLGGTQSLVAYATDVRQTPLYYAHIAGHNGCCKAICERVGGQQAVWNQLKADDLALVDEVEVGGQLFGDSGGGDY